MSRKIESNYSMIDGIITLQAWVGRNQIDARTELCPFCRKRHLHGTGGGDWSKFVETKQGVRTLGHRAAHCIQKGIKIVLPDGTEVCSDNGYYLGIGEQQPDVSSKLNAEMPIVPGTSIVERDLPTLLVER